MRVRNREQEDTLLRLVKQAGEALHRLREQLAGAGEANGSVRDEARQAVSQLLGDEGPLLTLIDAQTAARIIGSASKLELWAQLLELEADVVEQSGNPAESLRLRTRASSLRTSAAQIED